MAIQAFIPMSFEAFFPRGAFMVGEVEEVVKWVDNKPHGQDLDKQTGHPLWQVRIIDADPEAKKGQGEITIKIASVLQPPMPPEIQGLPFRPVVFEGLSVMPYVKEVPNGRPRVAFSVRAKEMKAAPKARGSE